MNGGRPLARLTVLAQPNSQASPKVRRVYFVGDLIGDEKNGGMSMQQIIKTITDVWQMSDAAGGNIQFHNEAQLLVVTGTPEQVDFMEQTLHALQAKVEQGKRDAAASRSKTNGDIKPKSDETKK